MFKKSKQPSRPEVPAWLLKRVQAALDEKVESGEILCHEIDGEKFYSLPEWHEDQ